MKKTSIKFLVLCISLIILTEGFKKILDFDKLLYNSLSEQLTYEQIDYFFSFQKKWKFIGFLFIPIFYALKISIISTIIYIGLFFVSKKDITLNQVWKILVNAEFIFLLIPIFKIIWFYFFQITYTLEDIQYFYPLSALNIIGYKGLDTWLLYPLQTLNLFEVAYIIYLSYQIGYLTKTNADNGLKIVSYSYIPALLLWVTVIMFFTLNYS